MTSRIYIYISLAFGDIFGPSQILQYQPTIQPVSEDEMHMLSQGRLHLTLHQGDRRGCRPGDLDKAFAKIGEITTKEARWVKNTPDEDEQPYLVTTYHLNDNDCYEELGGAPAVQHHQSTSLLEPTYTLAWLSVYGWDMWSPLVCVCLKAADVLPHHSCVVLSTIEKLSAIVLAF